MDSYSIDKSQPIHRKNARKFSKIPEKPLLKKRSKNNNFSIDQPLFRAYFPGKSFLNRLNTLKKPKKISPSTKPEIIFIDHSSISPKFPNIETPNQTISKVRMSLKGKEDRLESLINNFIEHKPRIPATQRFKENAKIEFPQEIKEQNIYEQNLENMSRQELVKYQNDYEKNLKIEKLRLKNYKKNKERLKSM